MRQLLPVVLCGMILGACADGRIVERPETVGLTDGVPVAAGDTVEKLSPSSARVEDGILDGGPEETVIVSRGFDVADAEYLPRTRACRRFISLSRKGSRVPYRRLVASYDSCLNSDRNHPTSRKLSCGKGRYYHMRNGVRVCA